MPKEKYIKILQTDLLEHPAVKAWAELRPEGVEPEQIEILKRKKKTEVYRLKGVGPGGSAIIAKRSVQFKASVERTIYEEILPCLPVSSMQYYGFVEEEDGQYGWLFLAPADGEEYSAAIKKHRALSAQWLALLHTSAAQLAATNRLPSRGPSHYLAHLQSARDRVVQGLTNPALSADDLGVLKRVISQCDILRSRWSDVEGMCAGMPQTLVHGDFAPKNMRVRTMQAGIALQVFDWGTTGWGVPAPDLVQSARPSESYWVSPDLDVYGFIVRECWSHLDIKAIQSQASVGKIFRALVCLNGDAKSLESQWIDNTMGKIRMYQSQIDDAIQAAGFRVPTQCSAKSETILNRTP